MRKCGASEILPKSFVMIWIYVDFCLTLSISVNVLMTRDGFVLVLPCDDDDDDDNFFFCGMSPSKQG